MNVQLSGTWFDESERAVATSLTSMSNLLGIAVSYFVSPAVMADPSQRTYPRLFFTAHMLTSRSVQYLMMVHFWVCLCSAGLTVCLFRSAPPTPPSRSSLDLKAAIVGDIPRDQPYWQSIKTILKNKVYLLCGFAFALGYGFFNGLFTVMNQMMVEQGYTEFDVSVFGNVLIWSGLVGACTRGHTLPDRLANCACSVQSSPARSLIAQSGIARSSLALCSLQCFPSCGSRSQ